MLHDARGDEPAAFKAINCSLSLAQNGGFIRLYVDLGSRMASLLNRLDGQGNHEDYIAQILGAFVSPASTIVRSPNRAKLIEPLTERENQILVLLAERLSNKEIAQKLIVSPVTVKRHTINIYQKLGVGSRREAVARAVALGILPIH
jgi:LuxR family maltose regulon positive regulatory protein